MAQIHQLDSVLADQISAGEVVERPASVVKELVENAIDAGSTQIDIAVEDAGLKQITVIDNGNGIPADEVELAFLRHATSKITKRQDLFQVVTLGFRGEALPSIVSVADVTMQTAIRDQPGTWIHVKGGKILAKKTAESRQGTKVTVNDLFFNTPARLKYLSSVQTELAAITDIVDRLALSHTQIAFSLTSNGRELLHTAGNGNLKQVISAIYGINAARQMVSFAKEDNDFKVSGFVSLPKLTRASRNYVSFLLNGRYVKNNRLSRALIAGYGSKLMVGRYPLAVIEIKLDPLLVDVNVHPTKQEVKISKEDQLCELLSASVYQRIAQENLIPDALSNLHGQKKKRPQLEQLDFGLNEPNSQYGLGAKPQVTTTEVLDALLGKEASAPKKEHAEVSSVKPLMISDVRDLSSPEVKEWDLRYAHKQDETNQADPSKTADDANVPQQLQAEESRTEPFPNLNYIGQMHGTFLFAEAADGFYIIDQHAAQERVKYEFYREQIGQVSDDQQSMLLPLILSYPVNDALRIMQNRDKLAEVGLKLEDFGQNTFAVRQHPTWFEKGQEEDTIREMIDYVLEDNKLTVAKFREKTAIMMSCKRSIKANHHLDERQARSLLEQLKGCQNPYNCPHGRPTVVHFTNVDMEKMFKRIQDPHQGAAKRN
ncbi:DNA mismatch repair protein MutL [Ligilactobacillus salitolerans]|uniref:DNA mismatch repair protein MutL n=1 Tax=Ligilactobacillus salitolerans TaxID=1808352 RepID=A0A401ISS1_9LACO|nr:DNA mismatch repair endonuclease MutL [Ligilactobacillus salitolerans]GBG94590.1 DNA mismatch repair protein MutL [Ligilactobacillus salitolerans]